MGQGRIEATFDMLAERHWLAAQEMIWHRACAAFLSGATVIFYTPVSDGIEIVRVMNSR
jgi:hypothetical protein